MITDGLKLIMWIVGVTTFLIVTATDREVAAAIATYMYFRTLILIFVIGSGFIAALFYTFRIIKKRKEAALLYKNKSPEGE